MIAHHMSWRKFIRHWGLSFFIEFNRKDKLAARCTSCTFRITIIYETFFHFFPRNSRMLFQLSDVLRFMVAGKSIVVISRPERIDGKTLSDSPITNIIFFEIQWRGWPRGTVPSEFVPRLVFVMCELKCEMQKWTDRHTVSWGGFKFSSFLLGQNEKREGKYLQTLSRITRRKRRMAYRVGKVSFSRTDVMHSSAAGFLMTLASRRMSSPVKPGEVDVRSVLFLTDMCILGGWLANSTCNPRK